MSEPLPARPEKRASRRPKPIVQKIAYNVPEAAAAIGVSRATLFAKIKAGSLPSFMACGRRLIWADDLRAFIDGFRVAA